MSFIISLLNSMPGAIAQGLIWGIMAVGVYITYRVLDVSDLTVDGSLCTGGAVCVILTLNGVPMTVAIIAAVIAGMLAGMVTGILHTACGIPAILAGILTQLALYSINLHIMGWGTDSGSRANLPISVDKYDLWVSSRFVRDLSLDNPYLILIPVVVMVIGILYWLFGTEIGCSMRATGANQSMARAQGIKVGMFRAITVWPSPEKELKALSKKIKSVIVAEHNYGQYSLEVQRIIERPVGFVGKVDGTVITPDEVLAKIKEGR